VLLPVAAVVPLLWLDAALIGLNGSPSSMSDPLNGVTAMLLVISPFVGLYLGHRSERFDMKPFLATQPLGDGDQAAIVLRHVAAVCAASTILWLVGMAVAVVLSGGALDALGPLPKGHGAASLVLTLAVGGALLGVWTLVGLAATLAMARSWFVPAGGVGAAVLLIMAFIAMKALPAAEQATKIMLAAGCLGGTLAAFAAARRRKLVSTRAVLIALGLCVLPFVCLFVTPERVPSLEIALLLAGCCAVPLSPLALAPLALAWNRHR
jgi:hypothetical protein